VILGDFLSYEFGKLFDLIVGNPPYVHFSNLPKHLAERVKEIAKTDEGDIYRHPQEGSIFYKVEMNCGII
jgi:methylase of polypeptide subunit release factors